MMATLSIIIFFLSLILPGYFIFCLFTRPAENKPLFLLPAAYGLGAFFVSLQLFIWIFLARQPLSLEIFFPVLAAETALLFLSAHHFKALPPWRLGKIALSEKIPSGKKIVIWFLAIAIAASLSFSAVNAIFRPPAFYDSLSMWSFKAKLIFYEGGGVREMAGLAGHWNYPWGAPFLEYWLSVNMGEYDDSSANLIFVVFWLGLLAAVFSFLKDRAGIMPAVLVAFFLSSMPLLFQHSFNSYADLPLAFYVFLAFAGFYSFLENGRLGGLIVSGIFWSAAFFTKDGAILFFIPFIAAALAFGKDWKKILILISVSVLPLLPWLFFRFENGLGLNNLDSGRLEFGFHPEAAGNFLTSLFFGGNWNVWWFLAAGILILKFKDVLKDKKYLFGWTFVFSSLAILFAAYVFTGRYRFAVDYTAICRNIMVVVPVSAAMAGLVLNGRVQE